MGIIYLSSLMMAPAIMCFSRAICAASNCHFSNAIDKFLPAKSGKYSQIVSTIHPTESAGDTLWLQTMYCRVMCVVSYDYIYTWVLGMPCGIHRIDPSCCSVVFKLSY